MSKFTNAKALASRAGYSVAPAPVFINGQTTVMFVAVDRAGQPVTTDPTGGSYPLFNSRADAWLHARKVTKETE